MTIRMQPTAEHNRRFAEEQARMGLTGRFNHEGTLKSSDHGGRIVFSPDPTLSSVPPIIVPYQSMAQLKAMRGFSDDLYSSGKMHDAFVRYPRPFSDERMAFLTSTKNICDLEYHLTQDEYKTLVEVAQAYLMGDSRKVADWEPLLNATFMPGQTAVFQGDELIVHSGEVLEILPDPNDPQKVIDINYNVITVEAGGQIRIMAPTNVVSQIFNADTP